MSIFTACMMFVVLFFLYITIGEVFAVMFRLTGLPEEKARFQVLSLLTCCGFTTGESELITSSKRRRNLARTVMLFGYAFNVTIVSAIINIFLAFKLSEWQHMFWSLPWVIILISAIVLFYRNPKINAAVNRFIEHLAHRFMRQNNANHIVLVDNYGGLVMAQVYIHTLPERLKGKKIAETDLRDEHDVLVMLVQRKGEPAASVCGETVLSDGDMLVVFGDPKNIRAAFLVDGPESLGEEY